MSRMLANLGSYWPIEMRPVWVIVHADGSYVADRQGITTRKLTNAMQNTKPFCEGWAAAWNEDFPHMPVTVTTVLL